jgi:hypothetical protein
VNGEELWAIDIPSSQSLLAGIVAIRYYRNREARKRLKEMEFTDQDPYRAVKEAMRQEERRHIPPYGGQECHKQRLD